MHLSRILSLGGAALSVIPIALGIVAVATRIWLRIKLNIDNSIVATYGLFHLNADGVTVDFDYRVSQGLIIAGIVAIAVGVAIALLLDIVIKNRWIHLAPQLFLYAGPTLIFIGLLLYAKHVFENVTAASQTSLVLGYSIIFAVVACLLGFLLAIYFAFVAGTRHSHHHHHKQVRQEPLSMPVITTDHSERF